MYDKSIEFTIKIKPDYFRVVCWGFWTVLSLVTIVFFIICATFYNRRLWEPFIFPMMAVYSIDLFFIRYILWQLRGREIVKLDESKFVISKSGSFLFSTETYEIDLISNFWFEHTDAPLLLRMYGKKEGKIKFTYMDMIKAFGPTIDKKEALVIIDEFNRRLQFDPKRA